MPLKFVMRLLYSLDNHIGRYLQKSGIKETCFHTKKLSRLSHSVQEMLTITDRTPKRHRIIKHESKAKTINFNSEFFKKIFDC